MKLSFFGYGKTTRAIADRLGSGFDFYDDFCKESWEDEAGNRIHPSREFNPDHSLLEILTPSIRPDSPLLAKAKDPISEYDLFLSDKWLNSLDDEARSHLPPSILNLPKAPPTVWISGTNGKTTTTQMLTWLLKSHGAISGGNIGTPLAKLDPKAPLWILETSSFTLHHTRYASPDIYLLLPITPDHLDWHGGSKAYTLDKLAPLCTMREGELALIPSGLPLPASHAWIVEYDSNASLESFFNLDASKLRYKAAFLQDALLALAISRTLFDEVDYDRINSFRLDRHRQEEIIDAKGRLWVNDSKATNLDATLKALEAYSDRHIHLIAGGDDKGVDMTPLIRRIAELNVTLYTIGSNSQRLVNLAKTYQISVQSFANLLEALKAVDHNLGAKDVALLSPSASSLDQFSSYAQRGDIFVDYVKKIGSI